MKYIIFLFFILLLANISSASIYPFIKLDSLPISNQPFNIKPNKRIFIDKSNIYMVETAEDDTTEFYNMGYLRLKEGRNTKSTLLPLYLPLSYTFENRKELYTYYIADSCIWVVNSNRAVIMPGNAMFLGGINKMSLSELSFWQRTDNESSISEAGYRTSSYYYSQSVPYQSFFEDLMKNSRGQELQDWEILGKPLISLTFSDLLVTRNGIPTIFQSVNNQLSVWQVSDTLNRTWEKKGTYPLTIEDYFTSFEVAGKLYIVQPDGRIYQVTDATLIEVTRLPEKLRMGTLLINKDTEEVYYLGQRALSMIGKIPIPEIMVTEAVKINVF